MAHEGQVQHVGFVQAQTQTHHHTQMTPCIQTQCKQASAVNPHQTPAYSVKAHGWNMNTLAYSAISTCPNSMQTGLSSSAVNAHQAPDSSIKPQGCQDNGKAKGSTSFKVLRAWAA